jgi:adenylate cyclase
MTNQTMPERPLPEKLQERFKARTVEEMWQKNLVEGNVRWRHYRHFYGKLPSNPRCVNCHRPFAGPGGALLRALQGVKKSAKNPRFCADCYGFTSQFPGGAEIELTMLFADVRGSTSLAETMSATEFGRLMNRFYEAAISVLVPTDAFIDNQIGDEITALFVPGFAGEEHAHKAVEAGRELLRVTGHGARSGPWVPIGVGIHTGEAWVGSIAGARGDAADFTALGDNVNVTARLASQANRGEVLISDATYKSAQLANDRLEKRDLELKGKSNRVGVRVIHVDSQL